VGSVVIIGFRNLLQARRRTLLLGLAIATVAAMFLILRVVSGSVSERMIEAATTLSAGHVNIGGFFKSRRQASDPLVSERTKVRKLARESIPEATRIIDRHRAWGRLIGPEASINVGVYGIVPEDEERFFKSLRLAQEKEYKPGGSSEVKGNFADLAKPNSALIFAAQAKKLGVSVGDTITIVTEGGAKNTVDLSVVAITSDIGFLSNFNIFVPRQTVLDLYHLNPETTGVVMVYLPDAKGAEAAMARLRITLAQGGFALMDHDPNPFFMKFDKVMAEDWLGQRLDLTLWSDEISFIVWVTTALDLVGFFVVGVLLLIISSGIMNSMWMAVRERTKEIGTMRAIGAQQGYIVRLFVTEGVLLGLGAGLLGGVFGLALISLINQLKIPITSEGVRLFLMTNTLEFSVHPGQLVSTLVLFSLASGIASLYPAFRAARLRPVEALMHSK